MKPDYQIYIVFVSFEIIVEGSSSLKAKRSTLNRIKDRIRTRFNASVAEVGYLDKWQRAALGITMISNQRLKLQKDVDAIETTLRDITDMTLSDFHVEWL